jgi:uncharacterized protein with HEPN domain
MMKSDKIYLLHIRDSISLILSYTENFTSEDFYKDNLVKDAVIRNLEIIGEASKKVSLELTLANPKIPWTKMAGMRDKLIHNYMGVDIELVWRVVEEILPSIKEEINQIISKL